jgi:transcriptional regulator of acetoin/glycerol metabolism
MHEQTARRGFLDKAWHSFVADGIEIDGLSEDIIRSWRRARDTYGIDPGQRRCSRLLTPSELAHKREQGDVYRIALPVLEEFGAQLAASQSVLTFFDAQGWMLSIGGDPRTADRVAEINFCPGANWREESVGTNGPGTALRERRPVEVFASEHFVEAWQGWNCSAAPILAPGSGELLGLVDITGPWTARDVQALVAARAIAHAVEERLRSAQMVRDQVVEYAFRSASPGGDALFAVDGRGRVLAVNDAARRRLAIHKREIPFAVREALEAAMGGCRGALEGELVVEWPGVTGQVRLVPTAVRFEDCAVGAVVRVPSPAPAVAAPRGRPAARAAPSAPSAAVARYDFDHILGESGALRDAIGLARIAARNELPVVLFGESGTGKELFAQAIHSESARAAGPFIAVNCGCIPAALLEAELFGYEAGTFTGGRREGNAGKFEEACGGTLFLDEVSELSPQAQTALLRVLQEREVVRLGGSSPRRVDLRVVAASNKSLPDEIRAGHFRADLYFRLNVLAIPVPPLRERRADVPRLAHAFLREAEAQVGRAGLSLSPCALRTLEGYPWPGNVRELRNIVLRAAATARGELIEASDLPEEVRGAPLAPHAPADAAPAAPAALAAGADESDREMLLRALEASSWNVARTAQALHVSRMTLYRWLHKHGIERGHESVP